MSSPHSITAGAANLLNALLNQAQTVCHSVNRDQGSQITIEDVFGMWKSGTLTFESLMAAKEQSPVKEMDSQ